MDAETLDIARRFAACPKWEWLPGMLARLDDALSPVMCRVVEVVGRDSCFGVIDGAGPRGFVSYYLDSSVPDLDDAVTRAALLPVVRRAWDDETASVRFFGRWPLESMWEYRGRWVCYGSSELAALLAALEAAPHA